MKTRMLATAWDSEREWDFSRIAHAVGFVSRTMVRRVGDGSGDLLLVVCLVLGRWVKREITIWIGFIVFCCIDGVHSGLLGI